MAELPNPFLVINGNRLVPWGQPAATAPVAELADLSIPWGQDSIVDAPKPATMSITLRYRGSVDVLELEQGDFVDVQQIHPDGMRSPFSGRIRNMSSSLDAKGRLLIRITATDHLADLDETYVATEWNTDGHDQAGGLTYRDRLLDALTAAGWEVTGMDLLPPELGPSSATFYSSIKLTTLLRRYLAQWGPQASYYDASYYDVNIQRIRRRIAITYMAATAPGDALMADEAGEWFIQWGEPDPLQEIAIPASNVLRDVAWESTPENLITVAQVSRQVTRREESYEGGSSYVTSLSEVNTTRGTSWINQHGRRTVEVETCTGIPSDDALHRSIGQKWMAFNGDQWRPSDVIIHDSTLLSDQQLSDLVGKTTRGRQWIVIHGVNVMTPRGARSDIRGLTTGGTLTWNHEARRWDFTMALADTQPTVEAGLTFADLAAADPAYSQAPAPMAGAVQFSAFQTISTIGATA